jgi:hypothetical protein
MLIAAVAGLGIGLIGMSPSLAAPAHGTAIAAAADAGRTVDQTHWRFYRHRHWSWRHHWHHRWWY